MLGRKKVTDKPRMVRRNVWLEWDLVRRVNAYAVRDRRKPTDVLRIALDAGVTELERRLAAAQSSQGRGR